MFLGVLIKQRMWIKNSGASLLVLGLLLLLSACKNTATLETIQQEGTLKVVTRVSPTTYYKDDKGPSGFEYILAQEFANQLGVELEIIVVDDLDNMFKALYTRQAHLAAAGLTATQERKRHLRFSEPYLNLQQQIVYHNHGLKPQTIDDVNQGKLLVMANSSHSERLRALQKQHPELAWHETEKLNTSDLLDMVNAGKIDFTIVDSNEFQIQRGRYPSLSVAFDVAPPETLAWAMAKNFNDELYEEMQRFMRESERNGLLAHLTERYYGHSGLANRIGTQTFNRFARKRLPKYQELIETVAEQHNMDWRFLAAISYQESHWNPRAKSPTGVRGMMMLTLPTAKEMDVTNRLDAEQSLRGGARYFNKIMKRLPYGITGPDRLWFTLAAYNVGLGHLKDAIEITEFQGGDPHKWVDVKQRLPLLQKKVWYAYTNYGYARGNEPVNYVQRIRHYYDLLRWHNPSDAERLAERSLDSESTEIASYEDNPMPALSNVL